MPHVSVKIVGKTEREKAVLAEAIAKAVMAAVGSDEAAISVAVEDVEKSRWMEQVYDRDIRPNWDRLYKKPGYGPAT